jgi:uncharacterized protein (TIGR02466 family)
MDFSIPVTEDIAVAFGTPVLSRQIPDFQKYNDAIKARILAAQSEDSGVDISNRGGWQSQQTLWGWEGEEFDALRGWVHASLLRMAALTAMETDLTKVDIDYFAAAWANINRRGNYNSGHIHNDAHWACVYYVECGTLDPGREYNGQFELRDPRTLAQSSTLPAYGFARSLMIDPKPGQVILFPAWMEHSVHPFEGEGERFSIAVNIRVTGGRHSGF